jgi:hypothetical protein
MNWLTKWLGREPASVKRAPVPTVEELEDRRVLSLASFTVASAIVHSTENFGNFVTSEYVNLLRRAPDAGGFASWVHQLEAGLSPATVETGFVASPEYIEDHGNNAAEWLNGIYLDLLGRPIDAGALSFWTEQLARGATPFAVAAGIETSAERDSILIVQDYLGFLDRAPSIGEIDFWVSRMQDGVNTAELASAIVGSDEFYLIHGDNNADFIVATYETVLNRTPDLGEVDFWLGVMDSIPDVAAPRGK